jgi:nucleotide-binding universal stress UspA family protein
MSSKDRFIIVVGVDFSVLSGLALDQALQLATLHEGAEVHALYVEPDPWTGPPRQGSVTDAIDTNTALLEVQKNAADHLAAMPAGVGKARLRRVVAHFRRGSPAQNVAQLAADLDADLVIVGSHGHRGVERFFLGSVAERVSRLARCAVMVVRPKDHSKAGVVPEIEPPCPDCVKARVASGGAALWCARHSEHHVRPHGYSYSSDGVYSADTAAYASTPGQ